MKTLLAVLFLFAPILHAQQPKGLHESLNLVAGSYDSLEADEGAVYVKKSGTTAIAVTQSADSAITVTDADGSDGQAAISLPAGSFSVWATASGKPGGSASFNGVALSRAKGKRAKAQDVTSAAQGESWTYENKGLSVLQLRFYPAKADSMKADTTKADTTARDST